MITDLLWIPRGAIKLKPDVSDPSVVKNEKELDISEIDASFSHDDSENNNDDTEEELFKDLKMEDYDNETIIPNDPILAEDEDEEDMEDIILNKEDLVIAVAYGGDEGLLDIQVFDPKTNSLWSRNDYAIPEIPICLSWSNSQLGGKNSNSESNTMIIDSDLQRSYLAVGTMSGNIEIWNLNVVEGEESITPSLTLTATSKSKSVQSVSFHPYHPSLLASGYSDSAVRLWDIERGSCIQTLKSHASNVQVVNWRPDHDKLLLSAGFDKKVYLTDFRSIEQPKTNISLSLNSDPESTSWCSKNTNYFALSSEDGFVHIMDLRNSRDFLCRFLASDSTRTSTSSVSFNYLFPNILATGSEDSTARIWDLSDSMNNPTLLCFNKMSEVGPLYSLKFFQDSKTPLILAAGGRNGQIGVWKIDETNPNEITRFKKRYNYKN